MHDLSPSLQALAVRLTRKWTRSRHRDTPVSPSPESSVVRDGLVRTTPDLTELLAMPPDQFMREGQLLETIVAPAAPAGGGVRGWGVMAWARGAGKGARGRGGR